VLRVTHQLGYVIDIIDEIAIFGVFAGGAEGRNRPNPSCMILNHTGPVNTPPAPSADRENINEINTLRS
jgi:hypothetical protein